MQASPRPRNGAVISRKKCKARAVTRTAWFLFGSPSRRLSRGVRNHLSMRRYGRPKWLEILAWALTGTALLAAIAWAMLRYSRKLPITQFFVTARSCIAILAVTSRAKGIGALQEDRAGPVTPIAACRESLSSAVPGRTRAIAAQLLALVVRVGCRFARRAGRERRPCRQSNTAWQFAAAHCLVLPLCEAATRPRVRENRRWRAA